MAAIIPQLFADKGPSDQVRVWVPACATGEEAYSVAMLLLEHALTLDHPPTIQIFATDISERAIAQARRATYPETIAGDVSAERLRRFFVLEHGRYRVKQEVRELVMFATHNLLRDPPFTTLDLITCRNLLIYLARPAQEQVIQIFQFSLRPGGDLLLGTAESLDSPPDHFVAVAKAQHLYRRARQPSPMPVLSLGSGRPAPPRVREPAPGPEARSHAASDRHHQLLLAHLPPSALITADDEILHLTRGASRFLQLEGEPSAHLLRLAHPDLRLPLQTALFQARRDGQRVERRDVPVAMDGTMQVVDLVVEPVGEGELLVLFADGGPAQEEPPLGAAGDGVVHALHRELAQTKEQLQITVEQYATSSEEYKAANEELQAINEELRAATEELETSKEELQAVNEELSTVNQQLKHTVAELSEANNDLQNLIAATAIATLFLDRDLHITRYTPSAEQIFNLIPTDRGRPLAHVTHSLQDAHLADDAAQVLRTLIPIERELARADGPWYLVQIRPYRTTDDHIAGVVITCVDITARKLAEAERERLLAAEHAARTEVEAALTIREQFLSIAAHELRTPLTALIGFVYMLPTTVAQRPALVGSQIERITRQAQRLTTLIDQMLDVSRLQQGQFVIECQAVDLTGLVIQGVEAFRATQPVDTQHPIDLDYPGAPVHLHGDPNRLEQVLQNLLSNAVKYSPAGGPVQVRVAQTATDALLEVTDQGLGIPAAAQAKLFEPFYRASNVGGHISGFGVGLHIVREIVARHGGRIAVESTEGQGSTFRVTIPLLHATP